MSNNRIPLAELTLMTQSKYVCTKKIKFKNPIFGDDKSHTIEFDIFDGLAYGRLNNTDYWWTFPKKTIINSAKELANEVRTYLNLADDAEIGESELMLAYCTLSASKPL